jgi:hypothetical protein
MLSSQIVSDLSKVSSRELAFVEGLLEGLTQIQAYRCAKGGAPAPGDGPAASRMAKRPHVRAYLAARLERQGETLAAKKSSGVRRKEAVSLQREALESEIVEDPRAGRSLIITKASGRSIFTRLQLAQLATDYLQVSVLDVMDEGGRLRPELAHFVKKVRFTDDGRVSELELRELPVAAGMLCKLQGWTLPEKEVDDAALKEAASILALPDTTVFVPKCVA